MLASAVPGEDGNRQWSAVKMQVGRPIVTTAFNGKGRCFHSTT